MGDLNLWVAGDLSGRFYSGGTRASHGTHLSMGDRMWSNFPHLRPMATVTDDTLDWYGFDAHGLSVHDVIGTRCDPYTHSLLSGGDQYHHCCHSNLSRALADRTRLPLHEAEMHVHDVLNVSTCTGFSLQTGQSPMKASPVRPGDHLELFAEIDLLGALSARPGGARPAEHSSDLAACLRSWWRCSAPRRPRSAGRRPRAAGKTGATATRAAAGPPRPGRRPPPARPSAHPRRGA